MPIFSCMVKRLIVKDHIFPLIPSEEMFIQIVIKKTGSTTVAVADNTLIKREPHGLGMPCASRMLR